MSALPAPEAVPTPSSGRAPARPVRRRMAPDERREDIVQTARGVFARQGLSQTGVRDIAAAAGVSVGTVTYHFTGIAEILAEVITLETSEVYAGDVVATSRQAENGRAQLESYADLLLSGTRRMREHWWLWFDFWTLSAREPRYARWRAEHYKQWRDEVASAFRRGAEDGSLPRAALPGTDVAAAVSSFIALVDGLVVQAYLPLGTITPKRAREILREHVAAAAGG
ncbi:TetR/AcrR family transcriptional regulator [Kineococcus gynurae]|uniref:TetR/AcrR family transcriptional regulator n=1 Tax=Kineococcus gynurae TaxID=452979 RepID=A0ABV5LVL7_9ACTN